MTDAPQAAIDAAGDAIAAEYPGMGPHTGRKMAAIALDAAAAVLAETLRSHWLAEIDCDHERQQDNPICACSLVHLGWRPSVGAAVDAWIEHVMAVLNGDDPKVRAVLYTRQASAAADPAAEAAQQADAERIAREHGGAVPFYDEDEMKMATICPDRACRDEGCPEHPAHHGPDHTYEQHHDRSDHVSPDGSPAPGECRCDPAPEQGA